MKRKLKILFNGEASYLSTGFAVYQQKLMKMLNETGKYELAELASYGSPNDIRGYQLPWKYYGNFPLQGNTEEEREYTNHPFNQFGRFRLESVLLNFQPDITINARDPWMSAYEGYNPFRKLYTWIIQPTIDSLPQHEEWMGDYALVDIFNTWTDWAFNYIRDEQPHVKLGKSISPGVDEIFQPQQKKMIRKHFDLDENSLIIGTVMRNQRRKLYSDLMESFHQFLNIAPKEIAEKTYLYIHACPRDLGWSLGKIILENSLSSRVYFTYWCQACNRIYPDFFREVQTFCKYCRQPSATTPTSQVGIPNIQLCNIYNIFDVYIQYAVAEGLAMPLVEAAACGIPTFSVNYSAMAEVSTKLEGTLVNVKRMYREPETHLKRCLPDNDDLVSKLITFFQMPETLRLSKGFRSHGLTKKHYNWETCSKLWQEVIDGCKEANWKIGPHFVQSNLNVPNNLSNADFVKWGMVYIAGRPDLIDTFYCMRLIRDLNYGHTLDNFGGPTFNEMSTLSVQQKFREFDRNAAVNEFKQMAERNNKWENIRAQVLKAG